jgi:hypothetical protein
LTRRDVVSVPSCGSDGLNNAKSLAGKMSGFLDAAKAVLRLMAEEELNG